MGAFLKSYMAEAMDGAWCGRRFAVPDCGVADCVVFRLEETKAGRRSAYLMAFEAKLKDWRKALMQAFRYRYYANAAIVVLPFASAAPALENRHLFERFGVGLWTFRPDSGVISPRIAVKSRTPLNPRKREQAITRIQRRSLQLRKLLEDAEPL